MTEGWEEALDALSGIGEARRALDRAELEAVQAARRAGRSWSEIATRLGVTRQSAWERWRDVDDAPAPSRTGGTAEAIRAVASHLTRSGRVVVPDVTGMSWAQAVHRLWESDLRATAADPDIVAVLDPESPQVRVTEQKPVAGELYEREGTVTLWLGRGPGSAGDRAPLVPRPDPRARSGAVDGTTGESVP